MKLEVVDAAGKSAGSIDVSDDVFGIEPNTGVIWEAVNAELRNRRQGNAATLNRALVHGGGRKPYRQKGTGRARAGSRRSPIWVGGATVFGPQPKDWTVRLPKKIKRLAYRSILSSKAADGSLKVVKGLKAAEGRTREVAPAVKALGSGGRTLFVQKEKDEMLVRALRNIPNVMYHSSERLSARHLHYAHNVYLTEDSVRHLEEWLGSKVVSRGGSK